MEKEYTHQQFWQRFNERFDNNKEFSSVFNQRTAWDKVYYDLAWGNPAVHVVVRHLINDHKFKLEIYIENEKQSGLYEKLEAYKENIEQELEESVVYTPARTTGDNTDSKARIIYVEKTGIKEKADDVYWNEQIDWIQSMALKLKSVVDMYGADKKYSVNESVWVATAVMAYEKFHEEDIHSISELAFTQADIRKRGETINSAPIEAARTSQWCNGDHDNHTYAYLRALDVKRRLSYPNEFAGEKNEPEHLDMDDKITTTQGDVTMQEIYDFVHNEYAELAKGILYKGDIDYIGLLDYLDNNREIPYSNPEAPGISAEEKERLLGVKQKGQETVAELKKIAALCKKKFGLDQCERITWDDGTHKKTKRYLWVQMKYKKYSDNPISVSVFVDVSDTTGKARYRISLEIKNTGTDKATMSKYHSYFDLPINDSDHLSFVSGSDEVSIPVVVDESSDVVKTKIESGEYKKIQLCRIQDRDSEFKNADYEKVILEAVKALIPYYEYVIGKVDTNDGFLPLLSEYDPGITAGEYERFFKNESIVNPAWMDVLYYLYKMGGIATCKQIAKKYGNKASHYNTNGINIAKAVAKETGCQLSTRETGEKQYWPVLFYGKDLKNNPDEGVFLYKMREPVTEAIQALDEGGYFQNMKETLSFDKNTILYGPPGTGKTYTSAIYAVAICDGKSIDELKDYDVVMARYEELKIERRVAFTTFHQAYGYEEFIEGIKPVVDGEGTELTYTIEAGVFKRFCEEARKPQNIEIDHNAQVWIVRLNGTKSSDLKTECFNDGCIRFNWKDQKVDSDYMKWLHEMNKGDYVVSYCEGSKYIDGIGVVDSSEPVCDESKTSFKWTKKVKWLVTNIHVDIKAMNGDTWLPNFEIARLRRMKVSDLLKVVSDNGGYAGEKNDKPYVFVIDEINRGNISKIFGELITLIENTKREGMDEAASAVLPYSREIFSVPSNVYILGTMNTADRSIALMDTALRRRFQFEEMMPDADVLRNIHADKIEKVGIVLDVAEMLETINQRIEYLYDREHTIGHAFFTGLKDDATVEKLASIFMKSVIPLLQEYFYEDYSKIMLVLGDNGKKDDDQKFILAKETKANAIFRGDTSDIDIPDYSYEIQKDAFYDIMSYVEIKG